VDEGGSSLGPDENLGFLSDLQAWEQRPGEPPAAYHVFELYCHLPPDDRSVRAAVEKYYVEKKVPPPSSTPSKFIGLSIKYRWAERADDYWRRERRRGEIRLQERRDALYEEHIALSQALLDKIKQGLADVFVGPHDTVRDLANAQAKLLEIQRVCYHDDEEERRRKGRPREDDGPLPAIEDRLKPPEDEEPKT
jgi:hypothetical protein